MSRKLLIRSGYLRTGFIALISVAQAQTIVADFSASQ